MPVILDTREAEIRRIAVQTQPRQIINQTLSWKTLHKNRAGRLAQVKGPEFKPQYHKKKKKKKDAKIGILDHIYNPSYLEE
jgi:hypothetical protein